MYTRVLLLCIGLLGTQVSKAQDRVSEEDVNVQKLFIEAYKEKLLENYDEAINLYEDIVKLNIDLSPAYFELSRLFLLQDDVSNAINNINKAIELEPDNFWYQKILIEIYQKTGKFEDAASVYEKLIKNSKNIIDNEIYYEWADQLVKANKLDDAIEVYEKLESKTGFNEDIARRKQSLFLEAGDTKKAKKELDRLINAFPHEIKYRELLAKFYEQFGEVSKARKTYEEILKIDPNNQLARISLNGRTANNKSGKNTNEDLISLFQKNDVALELKINKLKALLESYNSTARNISIEELVALSSILETNNQNESQVLVLHGEVLLVSGNAKDAETAFKKAIDIDDSMYTAWEKYMGILSLNEDYTTLEKVSEEAIDFFPNQLTAYFFYGKSQIAQEKYDRGIDYLKEAIFVAAKDPLNLSIIHKLLAEAYDGKSLASEANKYRQEFDNSVVHKDPEMLEQLGDFTFLFGAIDEAVEYWNKALQAGNTSNNLKNKISNRNLYE